MENVVNTKNLSKMKYKYIIFVIFLFVVSCSTAKINKIRHPRQKTITCKLYSVINPEVLKSMLNESEYHYSKFYNEKKFSYVVYLYHKTKAKGVSLFVSSSFYDPLLGEYYFNNIAPNIVLFEDKFIFFEDYYCDKNIFQSQDRDTTLTVYIHEDWDDAYIAFDSLYNFEKAEKFEPISAD